jgi:uncharacterized protein (TIGR00369 family)
MTAGDAPFWESGKTLGWVLEAIDAEAQTIRVRFDARPEFTNPMGLVQGGFLTAMLDDTMGPLAALALGGGAFAQTLELKSSFLRPARPGPLHGEGRVVHRGRDIMFLEARLLAPDGAVIATASATARVIPFARSP